MKQFDLTNMGDYRLIPQLVERVNEQMRIEGEKFICERLMDLQIDKDILFNQTQEIRRINGILQEIKDKQEQGLLIELPCKVGDTVYVIPSLTNYRLNVLNGFGHLNKVHEQKVHSIELFGNNRYVVVTCEGMCSVVSDLYEENWFHTRSEAEEALAKMGGKQ